MGQPGLPGDAEWMLFQDQVLIILNSGYALGQGAARKAWPRGAVVACPLRAFLDGRRDFRQLYESGERKSLAAWRLRAITCSCTSGTKCTTGYGMAARRRCLADPSDRGAGGGDRECRCN